MNIPHADLPHMQSCHTAVLTEKEGVQSERSAGILDRRAALRGVGVLVCGPGKGNLFFLADGDAWALQDRTR